MTKGTFCALIVALALPLSQPAAADVFECRFELLCTALDECREEPDVVLPLAKLRDGRYKLTGFGEAGVAPPSANFDPPALNIVFDSAIDETFMVTLTREGTLALSGHRITDEGGLEILRGFGTCIEVAE